MKQIIYTCLLLSGFFLFSNNALGPVARQQKGYTGAPGDEPNTCVTCHNSGTFGTTAVLQAFDSLGTTAVTRYVLGRTYTLRLTISVTSGTPTGYGFQMIDIRQSNNANVKGFLPKADQAANIGIDTITASSRVYAGHNARLTSNIINVKWKAPSTDIGTVAFYAAANAVNGAGGSAGDNGSPSVRLLLPSPISSRTNELAENITVQLSPNPTPNQLNVMLDSKDAKKLRVQISDITGRLVLADSWSISAGQNQRAFDLKNLSRGAYMVQIIENQNIVSKKIFKL
jgi:hypothetical protein